MPADKSIQTQFAEKLNEVKAHFVPQVAALQRPVLGNVPVSKAERQQRFWQEDAGWTRDKELYLLGYNPDGSPRLDAQGQPVKGLTPQDVGLLKYPHREVDAKAGGRANDDRAQHRYMQELADLGPPPPEPLAQAAQHVEQANPPPLPSPGPVPIPPMMPPPVAPTMTPVGGPPAPMPTAMPPGPPLPLGG